MKMNLKDLKNKNLPKANVYTARWVFTPKTKDSKSLKSLIEAVSESNKYLSNFVASKKCLGCQSQLSGLFGSLQWGIVNGEAFCSECGYPVRVYHRTDKIDFINCPLPYHPNCPEQETP